MRRIAVLDVGKTNAKLALVDGESLAEIAVLTRPNRVLPGPPWPHMDLDGHWAFFLDGLRQMQEAHGIDAISVTTHGAAAVLLDADGGLAAPMLDYEHQIPADPAYDALRPGFAASGSPRLPGGLNLGAQLRWLLGQPGVRERVAHVVTYPQYWGWRLTGQLASDVTSLGCHTDLWDPWQGRFSPLVAALGLEDRIAPARRADEVLGCVTAEIAAVTGIPQGTPVVVGIHDSNASLYPHLLGRQGPFAVVSTGTWVVAMAVGGQPGTLDPVRDVLVNVSALGQPVPSARFMGGREYEIIRAGSGAVPDAADRAAVLRDGVMLLPAVQPGCGPYPDRSGGWSGDPATEGQRMAALAWYLGLMTRTCLDLAGAAGPVIVEGPFARNPDYLDMLATVTAGGISVAASATGTSVGAAMLCLPEARPPQTREWTPRTEGLADYAERWRAACQA
ncbi:FGGY-family carbohydrate kinase [Paracoccus rhizosphaerae]|uniref:FGGY-family carbohydrate kinase n=1 Tax=Paracoccus rhizosphaerae TaxID=1133347 RepID=A0ABV6CMY8_9RHOB|nr:FGGY-family carbohydrate kinase [Paracoccus rhizosphaerae]